MKLSTIIFKWLKLHYLETIFWIFYIIALGTQDWEHNYIKSCSIPEFFTLIFAIIGYGTFGYHARKYFINKCSHERIRWNHPSYTEQDIQQIIKNQLDGEPLGIFLIVNFLTISAIIIKFG